MHLGNGGGDDFRQNPDALRIYDFNYRIYVYTGFWGFESAQKWKRNLFKIYQFVLALVNLITVFSFFVDAVSVRTDLDKLSFNMTSSVLVFVTVAKVSMLRNRKNNLESVLNSLKVNLQVNEVGNSKEDKEIFEKRAELILNISKAFYGLLAVCYTLRVIADTAFNTRSYLIPIPFKEKLDDYYKIIYAQQVIVVTHFLVTVVAHDLLIYGVINQLIAHYEVLEKNFLRIKRLYPRTNFEKYIRGYAESSEQKDANNYIFRTKSSLNNATDVYKVHKRNAVNMTSMMDVKEEKARRLLRDNICHHQKLLREVLSFCDIYSQPLMVQVCGAVLLIGIVAIKILLLSNEITILLVQQIMYVGITLINILCLCSFGNELTSKSVTAGNALYDTPWYEMNVKNRKIVHLALGKFNAGPKLRGGSLVVINRLTYLKVYNKQTADARSNFNCRNKTDPSASEPLFRSYELLCTI